MQRKYYLTNFSKFLNVLPAFTFARAIANLLSICLGANIWSCLPSEVLDMQVTPSKLLVSPFPCFCFGNVPPSKASRTFCLPLRSIIAFLRVSPFFIF